MVTVDAHKIRVVYIGHVAKLSGAEIALIRLIEAMDKVDAHVILAEDGPLVHRLRAVGAEVEVMPLSERTRDLRKDRIRAWNVPATAAFDTAVYVLRLARRIRALHPDVVHTNTLKAGVYGSLAARLAGAPVVWHVRDRIAADYLSRSTAVVLRGLIAILPDEVIVNSQSTARTLWWTRRPPMVEHSAVPDGAWSRTTEPQRHDQPFVVGMVGRITHWKGQHVLLEAFARAFGEGDELAVIVGSAMFGRAELEYEAQLHERAHALGISNRVSFRGFRDDVWPELLDMDILVHASLTPEPFGQVVVEAMIAGTPVIAAGEGGPTEIVSDGIDGLLYPPGDVDALASALVRLRNDPDLRSRLAAGGRQRGSDFSPQQAAIDLTALYRRMLQRQHGGRP